MTECSPLSGYDIPARAPSIEADGVLQKEAR